MLLVVLLKGLVGVMLSRGKSLYERLQGNATLTPGKYVTIVGLGARFDGDQGKIEEQKKTENDLNAKILKITMTIKDRHPELSKYIEEMKVTIPDENNPEITLKNLKAYYDSLNAVLTTYLVEHPDKVSSETKV